MVDTEQKVEGEVTPEAASTEESNPATHYEKKAEKKSKSQIKREAVQAKAKAKTEETEETTEGEEAETPAAPATVTLISADKRVMEVSIGSNTWKGVEITVPQELESEIRRLLEDGGFYLKN